MSCIWERACLSRQRPQHSVDVVVDAEVIVVAQAAVVEVAAAVAEVVEPVAEIVAAFAEFVVAVVGQTCSLEPLRASRRLRGPVEAVENCARDPVHAHVRDHILD